MCKTIYSYLWYYYYCFSNCIINDLNTRGSGTHNYCILKYTTLITAKYNIIYNIILYIDIYLYIYYSYAHLLLYSILRHVIEDHHHLGGLNIPIYKLEHKIPTHQERPILLAFFPLNSNKALKALKNIQVCDNNEYWLPFNQPVAALRNYFGEKIALYYAFVGKYTH